MKRFLLLLLMGLSLALSVQAQADSLFAGLDSMHFSSTQGGGIGMGDFRKSRALVLIFTGNHCIYSKKYENRILQYARKYPADQVTFVLVNANDPQEFEEESMPAMQRRAEEKQYPCHWISDYRHRLVRLLGVSRNPAACVLQPVEGGWHLVYSGAIDDNPLIEEKVTVRYLELALEAVLAGKSGPTVTQEAPGCLIRGEH